MTCPRVAAGVVRAEIGSEILLSPAVRVGRQRALSSDREPDSQESSALLMRLMAPNVDRAKLSWNWALL